MTLSPAFSDSPFLVASPGCTKAKLAQEQRLTRILLTVRVCDRKLLKDGHEPKNDQPKNN